MTPIDKSRQCAGFKRSGERCKVTVEPPQVYCWWHDPENAAQRSRGASHAARSKKASPEVVEVKAQLRKLADDVLAKRVDRGTGSVVAQIFGVWLRSIEVEARALEARIKEREFVEIKLPEFRDVVSRLEKLETLLADKESDRQWG